MESVEQPQVEVIAKQGDRITHRLWVPVDIVTAASPDAIDVVSTASRVNESGSVDWTMTYKATNETSLGVRNGLHNEENFRSWNPGMSVMRSLRRGQHRARGERERGRRLVRQVHRSRATTTATPRAAPPTATSASRSSSRRRPIAHLDYGITLQRGQLSNGWNTVPLTTGDVALEILPPSRVRQAFVGRLAQWLPWNGAAHAFYRFYVDDWGIRAHTLELELYQRISRISYLRASYRFHRQTSASFFVTRAEPGFTTATADSDLAAFDAHTFGVKGVVDIPVRFARNLHADVAVERYFRTNDLRVSVYSCGLGFLF